MLADGGLGSLGLLLSGRARLAREMTGEAMLKRFAIAFIVLLIAVLSGCGSVRLAEPRLDLREKEFTVSPGMSKIYVFRHQRFGWGVRMKVTLDGAPVGRTGANTYMALDVAPGPHTLVSYASNEDALELEAEEGKLYFVWQEVVSGFLYPKTDLHLVDSVNGRAAVRKCKLIGR